MEYKKFLGKLRCPKDEGIVKFRGDEFVCSKCRFKISLPRLNQRFNANKSLGEKIFDIPILYNFKIRFLNSLNRLKIPIDPYIRNKEILDIGCGSYQVRYRPQISKLRVGIDPSVKALIKAQELYPESLHLGASADKLPFADQSFEVSLLLFTLHHLNLKQWKKCIKEVKRVTKSKIIIYDHIRNNNPILRFLQMRYWKIFDGGYTYPSQDEWKEYLKEFKIKKYFRVGSMFKHICFYEIDLRK